MSFSSGDTQKLAGEGIFFGLRPGLRRALRPAPQSAPQNTLFTCTNDGLYCVRQDEEEGGYANPSSLQCGPLDRLTACKQFVVVLCAES